MRRIALRVLLYESARLGRSCGQKDADRGAGHLRGCRHVYRRQLAGDYAHQAAVLVVVPYSDFPRAVELWDKTGKLIRKLADVPMADTFPHNGVFPGPRAIR